MKQSSSKFIANLLQLSGVILIIIGLINKEPALGGIGVFIGLIARLVDEYWDGWFG